MYIIGKEEADAVRGVIESGQLFRYRGGEGGETDKFEAEWAARIGAKYAIAVTSGTAALASALAGMGVGPGDEVIVPAYTWIASPVAVLTVGAIPVIAECDPSLTIDAADIERKITPRTKAVIPVHMSGLPCNMDAVMAVAEKHNLAVLEDACQADGGAYKGKGLGSIGDSGANSFNFFKIITCGEGGAMLTSDEDVYLKALVYCSGGCGIQEKEGADKTPIFAGVNYRTNEILSAILRVQLTRLDGILEKLRQEKRVMMAELEGEPAFTFNPINDVEGDCATVLAIMFETKERAKAFIDAMREEGVGVGWPYDSGQHIYPNWVPVMEKRGAHHPGHDPYQLCGYEVEYSKDMRQKTLDYLARTAYLGTVIDRPQEDLMALIDKVRKVANRGR